MLLYLIITKNNMCLDLVWKFTALIGLKSYIERFSLISNVLNDLCYENNIEEEKY